MSTLKTDQAFINALIGVCGRDHVLAGTEQCWAYGYDNSKRHGQPAAVVFPDNHEAVEAIVKLCNTHNIPAIARGRGTGTTGGSVPILGGVIISNERMDNIICVDIDNRLMVVQPGVLNQTVQDEAAKHGFFWPPDPTSAAYCTIGGNLALNSAGPRALKYGTPRENTLGLRAVTGSGEGFRCGTRTTKGVVGYDLTRLVIGSEGTLAVITEAILKLTPLAQSKATLKVEYRNMRSAALGVSRIMRQSTIPCALEFIDGQSLAIIRRYGTLDIAEGVGAILMIEVDGPTDGLTTQLQAVAQAAEGEGMIGAQQAESENDIQALWATRKALSPALRTAAPRKINEDVVVPVSKMADLIDGLEKLSIQYAIPIVNFGHAGNGNIHVNLLLQSDEQAHSPQAQACLSDVFSLVLALGGTLSGEHGIGLEKRDFVDRALDPTSLQLMRRIKALFDPLTILNPDKVLPKQN